MLLKMTRTYKALEGPVEAPVEDIFDLLSPSTLTFDLEGSSITAWTPELRREFIRLLQLSEQAADRLLAVGVTEAELTLSAVLALFLETRSKSFQKKLRSLAKKSRLSSKALTMGNQDQANLKLVRRALLEALRVPITEEERESLFQAPMPPWFRENLRYQEAAMRSGRFKRAHYSTYLH